MSAPSRSSRQQASAIQPTRDPATQADHGYDHRLDPTAAQPFPRNPSMGITSLIAAGEGVPPKRRRAANSGSPTASDAFESEEDSAVDVPRAKGAAKAPAKSRAKKGPKAASKAPAGRETAAPAPFSFIPAPVEETSQEPEPEYFGPYEAPLVRLAGDSGHEFFLRNGLIPYFGPVFCNGRAIRGTVSAQDIPLAIATPAREAPTTIIRERADAHRLGVSSRSLTAEQLDIALENAETAHLTTTDLVRRNLTNIAREGYGASAYLAVPTSANLEDGVVHSDLITTTVDLSGLWPSRLAISFREIYSNSIRPEAITSHLQSEIKKAFCLVADDHLLCPHPRSLHPRALATYGLIQNGIAGLRAEVDRALLVPGSVQDDFSKHAPSLAMRNIAYAYIAAHCLTQLRVEPPILAIRDALSSSLDSLMTKQKKWNFDVSRVFCFAAGDAIKSLTDTITKATPSFRQPHPLTVRSMSDSFVSGGDRDNNRQGGRGRWRDNRRRGDKPREQPKN